MEKHIELPAREAIPATSIYTRVYSHDSTNLIDRDVVILIPGGPGNDHTMYDTAENSIARTFFRAVNVILFDPRGCGNSQASPIEHCSLDHYIDDIEAIRQYFNIPPEKLIIFGQSYGSIAALGYAIRYADNLKKLLLVSAIASYEFIAQAKQDLQKRGSPQQIAMAEKIWHGTFESKKDLAEFCQIMGPLYSYRYVKQDDVKLEIPCTIDILNYGWADFLKYFDFRPELHQVTCQVLILWGRNEWLMGEQQVQQVHQLIAHSELIIYDKCGHMLWLDQWDKFVEDALGYFGFLPHGRD